MAQEITVTTNLTLTNGNVSTERSRDVRIDQATARYTANIQSIATTATAITIAADVATPGLAYFANQNATNYVELGVVVSSTFYPFVKLKPGETALLRLGTATPYARANTAACDLEVLILAN